jgi:hypothetical protein
MGNFGLSVVQAGLSPSSTQLGIDNQRVQTMATSYVLHVLHQ